MSLAIFFFSSEKTQESVTELQFAIWVYEGERCCILCMNGSCIYVSGSGYSRSAVILKTDRL